MQEALAGVDAAAWARQGEYRAQAARTHRHLMQLINTWHEPLTALGPTATLGVHLKLPSSLEAPVSPGDEERPKFGFYRFRPP